MEDVRTQSVGRILLCLILSITLIISGAVFAPDEAYGVTSAEKQAEADELMQAIDVLQTQINEANTEFDRATEEYETASDAADDAALRVKEANKRIVELKDTLSDRAADMYKTGGSVSFLDVLLEATSFEDFLTMWDMFDKITEQDAALIQETKEVRAEAEAAQAEYEEQVAIAEEELANIESAKAEIETAKSDMEVSLALVNEEIVLLQAKEEEERIAAEEAQRRAQEEKGVVNPITGWVHPCPSGVVSSPFGYRTFDNAFHNGTDYAAPEGTPIYAAAAGTVSYVGGYGTGGNAVKINHGSGVVSIYMHMSAFATSQGNSVNAGDIIGYVGSTGNSTGPHLHFQVEINGSPTNPTQLVGW